jgi:hypothetical protein
MKESSSFGEPRLFVTDPVHGGYLQVVSRGGSVIMAIAVLYSSNGLTPEQYDRIGERLDQGGQLSDARAYFAHRLQHP